MKTPFIFLLGLCGLAHAAPLPQPMYVRGAFNGWGLENALLPTGDEIHQADILVSPGNHAFKVGAQDWSAEWVADARASVAIKPDQDYVLDPHAGPEDFVFVRQAGVYRFRLDASRPEAPRLRISRVGDAPVSQENPHAGRDGVASLAFATWDGKTETARFSTTQIDAPLREYAQSTTMQLRDPGPAFVRVSETRESPLTRSGSLAFDALFALANAELRQNAVTAIRDGSYNGGEPLACACFETGEKWHYVWTRDLSYAADLGVALLDPARVKQSLRFKLSGYRQGAAKPGAAAGSPDGLQILQDTGTGGSWPVSTDRVAWAFGLDKVLPLLPKAERRAFVPLAFKALVNTIENDRIAAFDPADGLYRGEASFLDWRDQSYAAWIVDDIASLASAKSLSTNVAHYKALLVTAALAQEQGKRAAAQTYRGWAASLKLAINRRFWLPDPGMYASLTAGHLDGAPLHKFDWLGQSLAIVTGVASPAQASSIVTHYPHGPMGAPVIYPQQPETPVYHNRALWPFVTGYGLRAAIKTRNVSAADAAYDSLIRGAALNLSNMENLEWLSSQPLLLDEDHPGLSGPVINSRRQLWSVGAYLGMVIEDVFGVRADARGVNIAPFITARLRRSFGASERISLHQLRLREKRIEVTIALPPAAAGEGVYEVASVTVNGRAIKASIAWDALPAMSHIAVTLGPLVPGEQRLQRVNANPYEEAPAVFAPREPVLTAGDGALVISGGDKARYNLYRDGLLFAADRPAGPYPLKPDDGCYAAEALYAASGNRSHHSRPVCLGAAQELAWKDGATIHIASAGRYQIQLRYRNEANQINLGISSGVKVLSVKNDAGATISSAVTVLPHTRAAATSQAFYATPLAATLKPGRYRLQLDDFYNMSGLAANRSFAGAGGISGPFNAPDMLAVRLLKVGAAPAPLSLKAP